MRQTEFHLSYKILKDRFALYGASTNVPLSQILAQVLKQNPDEVGSTKISEYKILVAKQVVDPGSMTLKDLDLNEGGYLLFYRPQLAVIRLRLIPPKALHSICPEFVIDATEALIGRADESRPDVDLTPLLKDPLNVSRKLAWLKAEDEHWTIELHDDAHSIIFVDQTRLEPGEVLELNDNSVISFGNSIQDPHLTLRVKLDLID